MKSIFINFLSEEKRHQVDKIILPDKSTAIAIKPDVQSIPKSHEKPRFPTILAKFPTFVTKIEAVCLRNISCKFNCKLQT